MIPEFIPQSSIIIWMSFVRKYFLFFLLLLFLAWQIWPVLRHPNTAFAWGGDDGIITWQLNQTIRKIPGHLDRLFQGNIFYPYPDTVAYTMLLIPSAILAYIPVAISGNPITAYNTALIIAQFMTLSVIYFWLSELTKNKLAAFIGTVTFGFCQIRLFFDVHIHFWIMQWLVFSSWMLWKYARTRKVKWLYLAGLFLSIQVWESIYQAFWILIFAAFLLFPCLKSLKKDFKHIIFITFIIFILVLPVLLVYTSIYLQFGNTGSVRESAAFSMSLNDLWGKFMSPGLYLDFIISIFLMIKYRIKARQIPAWLWLIFFSGIILALGPALKWRDSTVKIFGKYFIPLPFGILYYLIPGMSYLRSVHRYIWLMAMAAAFITSVIYSRIKLKKSSLLAVILLFIAVIGGVTVKRDKFFPAPNAYPEVYAWLKNQPGNVILEYPVYTWADQEKHGLEMYRMVYSLKHGKYLINGASGFEPPERGRFLGDIISHYPSRELDTKLKNLGVNYLLFHKNELGQVQVKNLQARMRLPLIWSDKDTAVYLVSSDYDQAI